MDIRNTHGDHGEIVRSELECVRKALQDGNEGMARVCARRAAGAALAHAAPFMIRHPGNTSAMALLDALAGDDTAPADVRDAASRLRSKRDPQGRRKGTDDPLGDAECVIAYAVNLG